MRRVYVIVVCAALSLLHLHAATELINESFDKGLPSGWRLTADHSLQWQFTNGTAEFQNSGDISRAETARLSTTEFKLMGLISPQLIITHREPARSIMSADTLRIYYRTDASARWRVLRSFAANQDWQTDTIQLVETNTDHYQLAFEGIDNLGLGIAIDQVVVKTESTCAPIASLSVLPKNEAATILWEDLSSRYYELIVSSEPGEPDKLPASAIVTHQTHLSELTYNVSGLQSLVPYYVWLRSECDDSPTGYTGWLTTTFKTSLVLPYTENFNEQSDTPLGWNVLSGLTDDAFSGYLPTPVTKGKFGWRFTTGSSITGSAHMMCYISSITEPCWLTMPSIDFNTNISSIGLRFRLAMSAAPDAQVEVPQKNNFRFYVLLSDDGGVTWTAQNVIEWSDRAGADYPISDLSSAPTTYFLNLDKYKGRVLQVAFVSEAVYGSAYFHVDNVVIDQADAMCGSVSKLMLKPDVTSIQATWQTTGKQATVLQISEDERFEAIIETKKLTTTSYTFTNLQPHHRYYVRASQDCDESGWTRANALTLDGVPFSEDFSAMTLPDGWEKLIGSSDALFSGKAATTKSGWAIRTNGDGIKSTHISCEIYEGEFWAVSPSIKMNVSAGTPTQLSWHMALAMNKPTRTEEAEYSATDRVWIAVSSDNGKTWKKEDARLITGDEYNAIPTFGGRYKMELTKYDGQTIRIAFGVETPTDYHENHNRLHIDDITIDRFDPQCQGVYDLTAIPMPGSATLNWKVNGSQAVTIELATAEDFSYTSLVGRYNVTGLTHTLTGLDNIKQYYVRLRQQCSTSSEDWVSTGFETSAPLTYYEHFTNSVLPEGWYHVVGDYFGRESLTTPAVLPYAAWYFASSPSCPMEGVHAHINTYGRSQYGICSPNIYLRPSPGRDLQLDLYVTCTQHESKALLTDEAQAAGGTFAILISENNGPWTTLDAWGASGLGGKSILDISTLEPQHLTYSLAQYEGKAIRLCLYASSRNEGANYDVHVDDIRIRALDNECQGITALTLSGVTETTANVRCVMVGTQSANVELYKGEQLIRSQTTTSALAKFTSLSPNTIYTVRARQACDTDGEWSTMTLRTQCGIVTPEEFGLENFTDELNFDCWRSGFTAPTTAGFDDAYAERSSKDGFGYFLRLAKNSTNASDGAYAITPELNVSDTINRLKLNLRAASLSQAGNNTLIVGIITDVTDLNSFTEVSRLNLTYASAIEQAELYQVDFSTYDGDYIGRMGHYVMFRTVAGEGQTLDILVDDISFGQKPIDDPVSGDCAAVTNVRLSSTDNNITVTWSGSAPTYEAIIALRNSTHAALDTIRTSSRTATFTGLDYSSTYYVFVRSVCDGGGYSKWSDATFTETALGIPYTENFNSFTVGARPTGGWTGYVSETMSTSQSYRVGSANTGKDGWHSQTPERVNGLESIAMRAEVFNKPYNCLLTSPMIMLNPRDEQDGAELSFDIAACPYGTGSLGNAKTHSFAVFISTDGNNFQPLYKWASDGTGDANYNLIKGDAVHGIVDLTDYLGQKVKIGFMLDGGAEYYPDTYFWLDNVAIRYSQLPPCRTPKRLHADAATTFVELSWEGAKDDYEVAVVEVGAAITDNDIHSAHGHEVHIDGLTPGNVYSAYVRTVCAEDNKSEWIGPENFETTCLANIPVRYNFDDLNEWVPVQSMINRPQCWTYATVSPSISLNYVMLKQSTEKDGNEFQNGYTYSRSGIGALYLSANGTSAGAYAAMPLVDLPLDTLQVTFYGRPGYYYESMSSGVANMQNCSGAHTIYVGTMTDPTNYSTFQEIAHFTDEIPTDESANGPSLDEDETGHDFWRRHKVSLRGAKGKYIAFALKGAKGYKYYSIDDIEVTIFQDCETPEEPVITPTATTAEAHWTATESEQYELAYWSSPADTTFVKVTTNSTTLTGLAPMTTYHAMLRSLCSESTRSDWSEVATFTTDCETYSVPWAEDFEFGKATTPLCWTIINKEEHTIEIGTADDETAAPFVYSGKRTLYWMAPASQGGAYAILPEFNSPLSDLLFSFYYRSTNGTAEFGYITDSNDTESFHSIATLAASDEWRSERHKLTAIPVGARLAFAYSARKGGGELGLDNLLLSEMEDCTAPVALAVSAIGIDTTVLTWSGSPRSDYRIELATTADFKNSQFIDLGGVRTYTLRDLKEETTYYARAQRLCTSEDESEWTEPVTWKTASAIVIDPCYLNPSYTEYYATVCEGEQYEDDNFSIKADEALTIRRLYAGAKCDSVVTMHLTTNPMARATLRDTIYDGDSYLFGDKLIYMPGTYTDTTRSAYGCDSVTTLLLYLHGTPSSELSVRLCHGETYAFDGQTLTHSGDYVAHMQNEAGKDSVVTLHLTVLPEYNFYQRVAICAGELYSDDTFLDISRPGHYSVRKTSVDGCDSIVSLDLLVADENLHIVDSIAPEKLPYIVNGVTLLDENTPEGNYDKFVPITCGDAEITILVGEQFIEGIESVWEDENRIRKILIDGILYIERDGQLWTVLGNLYKDITTN